VPELVMWQQINITMLVRWTAAVQRWYRDVVKRHVHMAVLVSAPVWKSVSLVHYPFRMELLK